MTTEYKDIKGLEGLEGYFEISNTGIIRNKNTGRICKQYVTRQGYALQSFQRNNVKRRMSTHRAVAIAFIPNPDNKPQVNHINGDKLDNRVENLEWVTAKENTQHAYRTGLATPTSTPVYGEKNGFCKLTTSQVDEIKELRKKGHTCTYIAALYNCHHSNVSRICSGKSRTKG